jgi:hypothetical protein
MAPPGAEEPRRARRGAAPPDLPPRDPRQFSNAELARAGDAATLRAHPAVARFLRWIVGKPADFHARTAERRK